MKMHASDRLCDAVLLGAGHKCYVAEYEAEFQAFQRETKRSIQLPKVTPLPASLLLPMMRDFEDQLEAAWGQPPAKVYLLMGLRTISDVSDAFYLTLIDCAGYDICLYDQFAKQVGTFEEIVCDELEIDPFAAQFSELSRLARHAIKLSYGMLLNGHRQKIAC